MDNERYPKERRVRKQAEFDAIYRDAVHAADNVLVVQTLRNGLDVTRLGLSIGRKVGNAVVRNKWKRTIREVFRKSKDQLPPGLDIVVRPRKGATLSYEAVEQSLPKLVNRANRRLSKVPKR